MIAARLEPVASPEPFADDAAGFGYFATDFHYEHVVARLRRHLAATRGFYLVSGAPAPEGELVERAINARKDAPHRATLVRCRAGMTLAQVTRAHARQLGLTDETDGGGQWSLLSRLMEDSRKGLVRVLVLENADALDDPTFDELHRFATLDDPHFLPVVLLTQRSFAARLDMPSLQFLQPAIVAHLSLQHLETEEVVAFIRYQLNATDGRHEAVFTRDAIAAMADAAKGDPAVVNRLARQAAGLPGRRPASALAAPPPVAMPAPKPTQPEAEQPKPKQPKAEKPRLEPRIAVKAVEKAGPPAPKQATPRDRAPSAAKRSVPAPAKSPAVVGSRNSRKSSAPVASLVVATMMRARAMAPAASIAAYVLLAAVSAAAMFYLLAPSADREEADALPVQTVITSDLPVPAPRVVKPAASAPLPAVPPVPEITAAAPPPVLPEKPVIAIAPPPEPPQPGAVVPPAAEPPPASAAAPTPAPAPTQALAAIEPMAGNKSPGEIVIKIEPMPPSATANAPSDSVAKAEPAPLPPSAPAKAPSDSVAKAEPAPVPPSATAKAPSENVAKAEPAPVPPSATAKAPSESVAKREADPAPLPPRAADKPPSGATAALVRRGEAQLVSGDIVSARQFFARAAETGDAAAACGLGKSYDPLFLQRVGTRGVAGDPAKAVDWYRRAARAGSNEAAARLARLLIKFPQ